ncbi:hypothetical protein ACWEH1_13235, partial [Micromonospora chersina]
PGRPGVTKPIVPLDPGSPAGKAAAEAFSKVLAEILVKVEQRQSLAHPDPSTNVIATRPGATQ